MNPKTERPNPKVGVGAIVINDRDEVLLIQRAKPPSAGLWSVPGGRVELHETLAAACIREVFEETGIPIRLGPIVAVVERQAEGFHYVIIDFAARPTENMDPSPATDAKAARWCNAQEVLELPLVRGLAEVIEAARNALDGEGSSGLLARGTEDYIARFMS